MTLGLLPSRAQWNAYIRLARWDRLIGTWLLLWPTLWALWWAASGVPDLDTLVIFILGVFAMRAAGCVINDFADRNFDGHVQRTQTRPLATGELNEVQALTFFALLVISAFLLVLLTNPLTIKLSIGGLLLASMYPFMKRYTHLPQVVLGAAFSWAIPMAFAAQANQIPLLVWVIFAANVLWTVAYDTMYAMEDREDDLKIGIKSTAILFGRYDKLIIGLLQIATLGLLAAAGVLSHRGLCFYLGLAFMAGLFVYQQWCIRDRARGPCLKAFLNNHYAGMAVFIGLALDYAL